MIDSDSPTPFYAQLADIIREQIRKGTLTGRVPSVRTLAQEYGVSHVTAQRALELLRNEGLIVSQQGKGYYVAKTR